MKIMLLLTLVCLACSPSDPGGYEKLPERAALTFGASPECGLLPAKLQVKIPERVEHGACVLTTRQRGDLLLLEDTCPSGQHLDCSATLADGGSCTWTATGAALCAFELKIEEKR